MRRALALAVVMAIGLTVAPLGVAGEADLLIRDLKDALRSGDWQMAKDALTGEERPALVADPEAASIACAYVAVYARGLTEAAPTPTDVRALVDEARKVATEACAEAPDDADAIHACAVSLLALARHLRACDESAGLAEYGQAAKRAWTAFEATPNVDLARTAIRATVEAARVKGVDTKAQLAEAVRLLEEAGAAPGMESPKFDLFRAGVYTSMTEAWIEAKKTSNAKKTAAAALKLLDELRKGSDDTATSAKADRTRLITLCRGGKVKVKAKFYTQAQKAGSFFTFEVPEGGHWRVDHANSTQFIAYLRRKDPGGGSTRISLRRYSWNVNYTTDDGEFGGDNPTGFLKQHLREDEQELRVKRKKPALRGRLNKWIKKTVGYELVGVDNDDVTCYHRRWYFKGDHQRLTFCIFVRRKGGGCGLDAEIECILDSLKEVDPDRK